MCGIVGVLGQLEAAPRLLDALRRLEYRGYDSAGLTTLENGRAVRRRAVGKLAELVRLVAAEPARGTVGIGHTRWATHGAPTVANAHPHAAGPVHVVHNGIVENHRALREALAAEGVACETETDTEVVARLIARAMEGGLGPAEAVAATLPRLEGAFALAILVEREPDLMIAARHGSPLAIGWGEDEMYVGSDALALSPMTSRVTYLEDGDWAVLRRSGAEIRDRQGRPVERPVRSVSVESGLVEKGRHRHFMAKEIHEQPAASGRVVARYAAPGAAPLRPVDWTAIERLFLIGCGTACYAGLVAKHWFERLAGLPVEVDIASEFRYREPPLTGREAAIFVSQSGETADTLAALRHVAGRVAASVAVVNVTESSIAREAGVVLPTLAGPEIGVASTKAFTCQLATLAATAIGAGAARGRLPPAEAERLLDALRGLPRLVEAALALEPEIARIAHDLALARDVLYLGRGRLHPIALEGALKLKEISYIHAEGYPAAEMKHGPIALVDEQTPSVFIVPQGPVYDKVVSNMEEIKARGGPLIAVVDENDDRAAAVADDLIRVPRVADFAQPIVASVPLQLVAYHRAVLRGFDVDKPRNLAKSVTVE